MPARFVGALEQIFRMTPADTADLARTLYRSKRDLYEKVINAQLEAFGEEPRFLLTNKNEQARLRRESARAARSIAETYNRDLVRRVDQVVEAEGARGLNRRTLARRLSDWERARRGWKDQQITRTEASRTATRAAQQFARASGLGDVARYRLLPAESDHDDANDLAAIEGTLMTGDDLRALGLPAHPGERHSPVLALPEGAEIEAPWMGR